VQAHTLGEVGN